MVAFLVLMIIVLSLFGGSHQIKTITPAPTNHTEVKQPTNNSTIQQNTTPKNITKIINTTTNSTPPVVAKTCSVPKNGTEQILNGNFSTGTYYGWIVTNPGFGNAPLNITKLNEEGDYYGSPWNNYGNDNFMATTFEKGIAIAPGNITSEPFVVEEPFLNFKMISPLNNYIYVEILRNGTPVEKAHFDTYNASYSGQTTFENESIPLESFACQNVSVRVVFNNVGTSETKYVAVTGFYLSKLPTLTNGTLVSYQTINN